MGTTETAALPPVIELTAEESWQHFDAVARRRLGMSGEEFLRRLDAGEFDDVVDDPLNHRWIGYLAQLSNSVRWVSRRSYRGAHLGAPASRLYRHPRGPRSA